jgi:hypothetical protein
MSFIDLIELLIENFCNLYIDVIVIIGYTIIILKLVMLLLIIKTGWLITQTLPPAGNL